MTKTRIYEIIALVALLGVLSGCVDELIYTDPKVPEGESVVRFEAGFKDMSPALTRSPGNAIETISRLWVVIYNEDGTLSLKKEITDFSYIPAESSPSGVTPTGHVSFSLQLPNGKYRMYAVANMDLGDEDVSTEEKLKNINIEWDKENISHNSQMFGYFSGTSTETGGEGSTSRFTAPLTTIGAGLNTTLKAELRRAASKITVAYDGTRLDEGISIYIKSVAVKDIPRWCRIGADNMVEYKEGLLVDGEKKDYTGGRTIYDASYPAVVSKENGFYPGIENAGSWALDESVHSSSADALYFYENMQGKGNDKSLKENQAINKNGKPFGTYIEVDAYYESLKNNEKGNIKYRFMLGKDVTTDYDAERNHHYKLTLIFKKTAKDTDWHIEFAEQVFDVTPSERRLNYQGYYFLPDPSLPNLGHDFEKNGFDISVASYEENQTTGIHTPKEWTATFDYYDDTSGQEKTGQPLPPVWLEGFESFNHDGKITGEGGDLTSIRVKAKISAPEEIDIDGQLKSARPVTNYNLASSTGTSGIERTANCYIVKAAGTYTLPLVYGNAVEGASTYSPGGGADNLPVFKNHLGNDITNPYIKNTVSNINNAELLWQDEENLITDIKYDPNLYGSNVGGISFTVGKGTIKQGNSVIVLRDATGNAIWNWHIWVTDLGSMEETISLMGADRKKYDVMSVNLGWCSDGQKIKYYRQRRCRVTFSTVTQKGEKISKSVDIIKESHMAFPRGNNPYYQWGRKDPFVGSNALWNNKQRWIPIAWPPYTAAIGDNPFRFFDDSNNVNIPAGGWGAAVLKGQDRMTTREMIEAGYLVAKPDIWHNPPRRAIGVSSYVSENITYSNLWGGNSAVKTIYDPCPPGYAVGRSAVFSGLTVRGENTHIANRWFDVRVDDIAEGNPTDNLYEFYTSPDKYQSIIFPETGYRDWDAGAGIYKFGGNPGAPGYNVGIGYAWTRQIQASSFGSSYPDAAYNLEFSRHDALYGSDGYIRPQNAFYTCDGFPVRPVKR